ncbi:SDR family NAD(P)-dependent oxidoreductase [Chryseobacterium sp. Mn2064]|uniref:SDR family NAD(P)-dependent oxidoreductase n=1 Tax=Chryseobacterium sp. Mn2064 TaxID=3395263 RepID=UPI003BD1BF5F
MNTENIAEKFTAKAIEGKTVIVTGAANGIGRAEAELLALSGAKVVFTDLDDSKGEEAIKPFGKKAVYFHHDVTKPADWKNVVEQTIKLFGRIDGLVNNAGIYLPGSIEDVTEETLERQISVNQKGTFWGIQYAAEAMKKTGGSIVNTSSICGIRGLAGCIIYNSTKWAIRGITKTAASELGQYKIRVNAVLPGFVETNIISVNAPEMNEQAARDAALGRLGQPQDIAYLVRYLISDESSFVTGSDFLIDGGWTL